MPDPDPQPGNDSPTGERPVRRATLTQVIGAVLWSFFGVRKGQAMQRDIVSIKPHQVIIVAVVIAALLVVTLLVLVRLITRNG
jgi:hypothetical protein